MTEPAVLPADPSRRELVESWLARQNSALKALTLFGLGVLVLVGAWLLYPHTRPETVERELLAALLGAVVTIAGAAVVALASLWRQLKTRREAETLRRFDDRSWTESLRVGRMRIPHIAVIASSGRDREWTSNVHVEFHDASRGRDELVRAEEIREETLPEVLSLAESRGLVVTDGPCVDLVSARVRMQIVDGRRVPTYHLETATGSYFDFLCTSARLDAPLSPAIGDHGSLRDLLGVRPASIEDVDKLSVISKIGVGTAVVTSDDRLVLGVRGRTMIADGRPLDDARKQLHVVAEGMVPTDRDHTGNIDPPQNAISGLAEELSIGTGPEYGHVERLVSAGFFFDHLRVQPCFAYVAYVDLTWDELQTAAPAANDFWEVERLVSLPFNVRHAGLIHLLTGTHPDVAFASNHAAAVVWFALLHRHGLTEMRQALTGAARVTRPATI